MPGQQGSIVRDRRLRYFGSLNSDGTWRIMLPDGGYVDKVVRGPEKPFPFACGDKVGELTIIGWAPMFRPSHVATFSATNNATGIKGNGWHPKVRCSCGNEGFVSRQNLLKGRSTRCDKCAKVKASQSRYGKYMDAMEDDGHRTRLLNRLAACITRCHNQNSKHYTSYGARGITVCQQWRDDRSTFLVYVQSCEGWDVPAMEMDRIDNDRGYEPGNIRFVSRRENIQNRRKANDLSQRILALEKENAGLRHSLLRAQEQIHDLEQQRAALSA